MPTALFFVHNLFVLRNLVYTRFYDILAADGRLRGVFVSPRPDDAAHVTRAGAPHLVPEDMTPRPNNPLHPEYLRRIAASPLRHRLEQAFDRFDKTYLWRTLLYRFNTLNGFANLRLRLEMSPEQQLKEMRFSNYFPPCMGRPAANSPLAFALLHRLRTTPLLPTSDAWTRLLFDHHRPDVVVLGFAQAIENRAYVVEANKRGIPVIGLVNSWDHATTKGPLPRNCDALVVGCRALGDELVRHHAVPEARIHQLGSPYLDAFHDPAMHQDRAGFLAARGIPAGNRIIAFFSNTNTIKAHEPDIVRRLTRLARENAWGRPATLFLRLHPHDLLHQELSALHDPPHVVVTRGNTFGHFGKDVERSDSDSRDYINLLRHADVVVNTGSTVSLDALVFEKPVICLGYDGDRTPPASDSVAVRYRWDHLQGLVDTGAVLLVRSHEELRRGVAEAFAGRGPDAAAMERARRRYLEPLDGHASDRLLELVADMAAQHGPLTRPSPSLAADRKPIPPGRKQPSPWPPFFAALAARRLGCTGRALALYRAALRREPLLDLAHAGYAGLCLESGLRAQARAAFAHLQMLFPGHAAAKDFAARRLREAVEAVRGGRPDEAMAALDDILAVYPPEGGGFWRATYVVQNAMQLRGGILAREGRTEEALAQFRAILELAPERLDVLVNMSDALRYAGRLEEASRALDDLERADPGHPELERKRRQIREAAPAHAQRPAPSAREHTIEETHERH
jgi:tetratricopeptide (TPR) repeat protein